jgi:rare lipoprotein A (peptidoglycan hydrolase)
MARNHPSDAVLAVCARRPTRNSRITALAGILASAALVSAACSGNHRPVSPAPSAGSLARGTASWYGPKFNGRRTASGERYDMHKLTAAHPSLPFGTLVQVTNLDNGKQVVVRINDRGPFGRRRVIDLSYAAARELDMVGPGTAHVDLALLGRYDPMTLPPDQTTPPTLLAAASAPAPQDRRDPDRTAAPGIAATREVDGREAGTRVADADDGEVDASDVPADRPVPAAGAGRADAAPVPPRNARAPLAAALHYTVQVGAFGEVERAAALQQDLARRYPDAAVHSDGTWSRVQVGLFDNREQAEALRSELASAGVAAVVVAAH